MKLLIALLFAGALAAQSLAPNPIARPGFKGSGLNDMASGGQFLGTANVTYTVTVHSTGATDTFSWAATDGGSGSAVPIVGGTCAALPAGTGWQTLTHGVQVCFLAKTGHHLADPWTIGVTGNGTVAPESYMPAGVGAQLRSVEDKLREALPSILDFGGDPTGVADSTAAANACVAYGYTIGLPCHFPGRATGTGVPFAKYLIATNIVFPDPGANNNRAMGIVGDHLFGRDAATGGNGVGTQIVCSATYGSGDPTTGCIQYASSGFNNTYLILRDFNLAGPDNGSTQTSDNGIMIADGVSVPVLFMDRVNIAGFGGVGTDGLWINGVEDSSIRDVHVFDVDGCAHFSGALNATIVANFNCGRALHDGIYVEGTQSLTFSGGSCQSVQRTCMHLRGDLGVHVNGMHFEADNLAGQAAAAALWISSGTLFSTLPTASATAAAGATSLALTGLGTGTIPAGSWILEQTGRSYRTVGDVVIASHAATLALAQPLQFAIPSSTPITPLVQNGEAPIVEEAGYTGLGCDSHGLHCGYYGGYNENNSFRDITLNTNAGIYEFANPSLGTQYVNVNTIVDGCAGGPDYFPVAIDSTGAMGSASFYTRVGWCGTGLANADPWAATNGNLIANPGLLSDPNAPATFAGVTSNAPNVGSNTVYDARATDGTALIHAVLYYGNAPAADDQYQVFMSDDGGVTTLGYLLFANLTHPCIGIYTSCGTGSSQVTLGDGTSTRAVQIRGSGGYLLDGNSTHLVNTSDVYVGPLAATAVSAASYGDSTHYTTFTVGADGRLTAAASVALPAAGTGFTGTQTVTQCTVTGGVPSACSNVTNTYVNGLLQ